MSLIISLLQLIPTSFRINAEVLALACKAVHNLVHFLSSGNHSICNSLTQL